MFHKVFSSDNKEDNLGRKLESDILFNLSDENLSQNDLAGAKIAKTETAAEAIWQGIREEKQGNYKLAISYYRQGIEEDPESAKAYQLLSNVLRKVRQQRQSEATMAEPKAKTNIAKQATDAASSGLTIAKKETEIANEESLVHLNPQLERKLPSESTLLPQINMNLPSSGNFSSGELTSNAVSQPKLTKIDQQSGKMVFLPDVSTAVSGELMVQDSTAAAQIYVEQATLYFDQNQWQPSIKACREAIRICPNLGKAYKIWGNCLQKSGDVAGAMGIYAKALEVQPDMAEIYCNLGSIYAGKKNWRQAIEHYQKSSLIDPKNATPYRNLAKVWDKLGRHEQSTECFFRAIDLDPKLLSPKEHFELATNLLEENKIERAITCYKYCIAGDPRFVNAYVRLADALEKNGQTEAALFYYKKLAQIQTPKQLQEGQSKSDRQISSFLKRATSQTKPKRDNAQPRLRLEGKNTKNTAVNNLPQLQPANTQTPELEIKAATQAAEQQPRSAQAIANLGSVFFKYQQWQKAIGCYSQAIKLAPKKAEYYINLGKAWSKVNNQANANQAYFRGFALEPKQVSAKNHFLLGEKLLSQGRTEQATLCYRQAIEVKTDFAIAYLRLGEIATAKKKYSQGIKYLRQGIKLQPDYQPAYISLGKLFFQQEQYEGAVACYQQSIKLNPNHPEAFHAIGDALAQTEQWKKAIKAYQRAIQLRPDYSWSYNNLGDIFLKLEQWQKAAVCYQKAIKLKPDFIWSHQNLGEALAKLEQWEQAISCYRQVLNLKPNSPWTLLNLGDASAKVFRWQDAIKCYEQAVSLKTDFDLAYARLGDALVREERWKEAAEQYEQAIELNPGIDVGVYRNLKEALERQKVLSAKQERAEQAAKEWPYALVQKYQPPATLPNGNPLPKISIVTPSYNQGEFIEETILSVINQNYPNLEYILIDGKSSDRTLEVIEQYREHFSYVISEPDSGQSNAINKGFSHATGEIFTWLNSDDRLAPGALHAIALAFYTSGADAVAGVCQIYQDGVEIEQHLTSCSQGEIPLQDILDLENCWLKGKFFYQPEVMFTREIWEKAGGMVNESLYYSMDYEMWARFAANHAKLKVIGVPIAQYRMHPGQKTSAIEKYQPELLEVKKSLQARYNLASADSNQKPASSNLRRNLKIALLNDTGFLGGAGIAHQRLAQALALAGHQVVSIAGTLDWSLTPVDCQASDVENIVASIEPDLLVVGNIHNFQHPLDILERLTASYPTMFVMHDQWLLTGRCGYTGGCEGYLEVCDAECPTWEQYPRLAPTKIADAFARKQKLLQSENLLVTADSQWLKGWSRYAYLNHAASESYGGIDAKFQHLYYGVDLNIFQPQDKLESRQQLGIPESKFVILTGSQSLEDERKGFSYLLQALEIANLDNVLVLCFGHDFSIETEIEIKSLGYINSSTLLAYYYSAADLFVSPALEEAFGQTFIEAAACGTPSIGFGVGGIKEAISNNVSGCLVRQKTPQALAKAIKELYGDRAKLELLSQLAPFYVANNFSTAASYHSMMEAWANSGWLSKLEMSAVTKLAVAQLPSLSLLTVKGGNPQRDNEGKLPLEISMDSRLQGSGWYPAEEVNGTPVRWMKKLGSIITEPVKISEPLLLELAGIGTVDHQLLETMTVRLNGHVLKTKVDYDDGWLCRAEVDAGLIAPGAALLITIKVESVKPLSPQDPRVGSILVKSLTLNRSGKSI